ncbi:MAG: cytochrome c maturation protein CcmE [Acidobacteria bacterium]|nr:cytochrome c maturation protein CcmE [Acidobacteriota bacterium]
MKPAVKFGALTVVIVAALGWLAMDGINQAATYYVTIAELDAMDHAAPKRIRVGGDVVPDSIVRNGDRVEFTIEQAEEGVPARTLNVVYTGQDPLPDTFRDRAQALCDGKMRTDGVFEAQKIQAKCASKYEVKPGEGASPTYESAPATNSATD